MKKLLFGVAIAAFVLLLASTSCQYKNIVELELIPIDTTVVISFSDEVDPIWNEGSLCISCHSGGGQAPSLVTGSAYGAITGMGLVNIEVPAESIIYTFPHPDTETHSWKKYDVSQVAIILRWIEQGALDN